MSSRSCHDDASHGYKPSPYPISILPKVHLSKPRPRHVHTVDVLPTPLKIDDGRDSDDDDDAVLNGEHNAAKDDDGDEANHLILNTARHDAVQLSDPEKEDDPPQRMRQDNEGRTDEHDNSDKKTMAHDDAAETSQLPRRRRGRRNESTTAHSEKIEKAPTKSKMIEVMDADNYSQSKPQNNQIIVCTTCNKNEARYTCPKCQTPYCSVSCYRIHDGSVVDPTGAKVCTESFYKNRVLGLSNSNNNNDKDGLRGILARMHGDINDNLDNVEQREETLSRMLEGADEHGIVSSIHNDVKHNTATCQSSVMRIDKTSSTTQLISDQDLAELAVYVLQMGDDDLDGDDEHGKRLLESIPPHLLFTFECALASATNEASESPSDLAMEGKDTKALEGAWAPFWGKDAGVSCENQLEGEATSHGNASASNGRKCTTSLWWLPGEGEVDETDNLTILSSSAPTLDDRILALPPLPKRCASNRSTNQNMSLSYNILEVLYAASFVVRAKYSSSINSASSEDFPIIDEAALLLSQSLVLANDARYGSVQEVMQACAEQLVDNKKTMPLSTLRLISPMEEKQGVTWNTLALDVAILSYHRRYVLRMLLEALDICQSTLDCIKKQLKRIKLGLGNDSTRDVEKRKGEKEESKRQYKLAAKKIEYFLSWCSSMWSVEMGRELSEEVRAFVADWQPLEEEVEESSVEQLIRGIHTNDNDGTGLLADGILDLGGSSGLFSGMEDQMVSISTVRKKSASPHSK